MPHALVVNDPWILGALQRWHLEAQQQQQQHNAHGASTVMGALSMAELRNNGALGHEVLPRSTRSCEVKRSACCKSQLWCRSAFTHIQYAQ